MGKFESDGDMFGDMRRVGNNNLNENSFNE